ncbi:hypothetical protein [Streptomyces sp. NPDC017941]|uniref:hypothetical protein n=1 Tax=Streptomyces sp. NPDC017941 TaxID=3365018 RepID=UPI0037981F79
MTDSSLPGSASLPHHRYAEAVALVDGPGGPYEPDEWMADVSDTGVLFATFYYRRIAPMTVEGRGGKPDVALEPVVNGEAWPHGLALSWDSVDGWTYAPLWDEFSTTAERWDRLPVDRLASPAALRAVLVPLLDGRDQELPASAERWEEQQAVTLAALLDQREANAAGGSR